MKTKSILSLLIIAAMMVSCVFGLVGCTDQPSEDETVLVSMIDMETTLALKVGETGTLTATVNLKATNKNVTFQSSDEAIATVTANGNEATVTAVAPGEATITATAADGSGVTASCTVSVTQSSELVLAVGQAGELPGPSEEISGDIKLYSDGTCAVNAFYANLNAQLAFETTYTINDGVLSFDATPVDVTVFGISGAVSTAAEVTGNTVRIYCTEVNQSLVCCEFIMTEDQAKQVGITVDGKVNVESITLPAEKTVNSGEVFSLTDLVTFNPANPTVADVTVSIGDPASQVVYLETTNIYPLKAGTVTITVTSVDNPDASATMTLTVNAVERPTSLETHYFESDKTFAWALNGYVFKADGTVDILDSAGVLQVLGYYTLSEDGNQITLYTLNDAAAYAATGAEYAGTTYNLTKQEGSDLLQFDIGELLGMPGVYIALEQAQ